MKSGDWRQHAFWSGSQVEVPRAYLGRASMEMREWERLYGELVRAQETLESMESAFDRELHMYGDMSLDPHRYKDSRSRKLQRNWVLLLEATQEFWFDHLGDLTKLGAPWDSGILREAWGEKRAKEEEEVWMVLYASFLDVSNDSESSVHGLHREIMTLWALYDQGERNEEAVRCVEGAWSTLWAAREKFWSSLRLLRLRTWVLETTCVAARNLADYRGRG